MSSTKTSKTPYRWPDGSYHSKSWPEHQAAQARAVAVRGGASESDANTAAWQSLAAQPPAPGWTPPPGQAATGAPQPFDAGLEAGKLGANWNVGLSNAEAGYQRGNLAYDTGYDATGARNTANPYSQAQLLEENYRRSLLGARNSFAAMGQYGSGAYGRATAREDRLYAQDSNALQLGAQRGYHGIGVGQLTTYGQNALGVSGDAYASLKRSIYGS